MNKSLATVLRSTAVAAGLALSGLSMGMGTLALASQASNVPVPTVNAQKAADSLPDFSSLVAQNGPAVVNISVTERDDRNQIMGLPQDSPFSQYFRQFGPELQPMPTHGVASGFIVSPNGIIYTNAHVVDGASEVNVKLTDGREFKAKVLGSDKLSDIAVLKIKADHLPVVNLDRSDDVKVGEWVVAIGSPYGFENTVTAGIVSAKARALPNEEYVPFIQTDAAVNPGNSGGPLFNMRGQVVGINSQIYSRSGGYQGLSFAIPIEVALQVGDQIVAHGKVSRGHIGVTIQDMNQSLAQSFGLSSPRGALVSQVEADSPAAAAGIKSGDVIISFDGKPVDSSHQLPALVAEAKAGSTQSVIVVRNGKQLELKIKVAALSDTSSDLASSDDNAGSHGRLGIALAPPRASKDGEPDRVTVEQVAGAALRAGIQPGDVILAVNGTRIDNAAQLKRLIDKAPSHIAILVERSGASLYLPVDLG